MTVGEAIKLLEEAGFIKLNQKGSHIKYGFKNLRIVIVYHSKDSEETYPMMRNKINKIIKQAKTLV